MKLFIALSLLASTLLHASGMVVGTPAAAQSGPNLLPERYMTIFRPGQLYRNPAQLRQAIQTLAATGIQPTVIITSPYERMTVTANLMGTYFPGVQVIETTILREQDNESVENYMIRVRGTLTRYLGYNHPAYQRPLIIGHTPTIVAAYQNRQDVTRVSDGGFVITDSTLNVYHRFSQGVTLNLLNITQ